MSSFLALLSAYYLCDAAAALHPLPPDEALACAARYEAVRSRFADSPAPGPADRRASYLRFKAWEASNVETVSRMKAEAARRAALRLMPGEAA
jgi:hypothetical protein